MIKPYKSSLLCFGGVIGINDRNKPNKKGYKTQKNRVYNLISEKKTLYAPEGGGQNQYLGF